MVGPSQQTVTVDRISNSGNPLAEQQRAGKTIHIPAGEVGETYDVRLVDEGSHYEARLVDQTTETQPRQPSVTSSDAASVDDISKGRKSGSSHSFEITRSPADRAGSSNSARMRRMSRRKK